MSVQVPFAAGVVDFNTAPVATQTRSTVAALKAGSVRPGVVIVSAVPSASVSIRIVPLIGATIRALSAGSGCAVVSGVEAGVVSGVVVGLVVVDGGTVVEESGAVPVLGTVVGSGATEVGVLAADGGVAGSCCRATG
ncbi:MAG: hypothetical protein V9E89_18165 [Ilumatobacteraceae bacterium]